ncbi:hypothetical protein KCU65_g3294, partial [Aureobasidium melanogenum]
MVCADENLSAHDLAAIRRTCKELHAASTNEFAQRHFKDPFVMMTRKSLEALIEICKHPVFGPHVSKIQLLNNFFRPEALEDFAKKMATAYYQPDVHARTTTRRKTERYTSLIAEQYGLHQSGAGLKLLRQAFEVIAEQGRSVTVASQKFNLACRPIGWSKIAQDFPGDNIPKLLGKPETFSTTRILLEAAQAGACATTKLVVGVDTFVHPYNENESRGQLERSFLQGILDFDFHFEWQNRNRRYNDLACEHLAFCLQRLSQSLKTFVLSSDAEVRGYHGERYLVSQSLRETLQFNALRSMHPNALENIHLSKIFLQQHNLLVLLDIHGKTLKKLVLTEVHLYGDWDQVLSHIAAELSLSDFSLHKAYKVARDVPIPNDSTLWYSKICELQGSDGIGQSLNKFVEMQRAERRAEGAGVQA